MGTVRFVLAMMVVFFHIALVPKIGTMAVQAFFVLSGFLMTLVMHRSYGYSPQGFGRFWANRALRLYPMYLLVIALTLGVISLLGAGTASTFKHVLTVPATLGEWIQNLTFIYWNWFPNWAEPRLSPPSWALTIEMFYYLLISLGLSRFRWSTWLWFLAGLGWFVWVIATQKGLNYGYYHIASGALPFSLGALAWHYQAELDTLIKRFTPDKSKAAVWLICAGFAGLFAGTGARLIISYKNWGETWEVVVMFLYVFMALGLIVGTSRLALPASLKKWDKLLGDLSYPVYIAHYLFALLVAQVTGLSTPDRSLQAMTTTLLMIPLMLAGCWCLNMIVDKPIERIRDWVRGTDAGAR